MWVSCEVEAQLCWAIVDTGASWILIRSQLASAVANEMTEYDYDLLGPIRNKMPVRGLMRAEVTKGPYR